MTWEAEDNYHFVGFMAELKNRINIRTELELTYVYAKHARALFDFCRPVFISRGFDPVKLERRKYPCPKTSSSIRNPNSLFPILLHSPKVPFNLSSYMVYIVRFLKIEPLLAVFSGTVNYIRES